MKRHWKLVLALLLLAAAAGCGGAADRPAVPDPDTSEMAPPVARAIRAARDAVVADSDSAAAWGKLGMVFDAHELYGPAISCYERAQELDPDEFRWPYLLGMAHDLQGKSLERVRSSFETAIRLEDASPVLYFRYGEALIRQGALPEARDAFLQALELDGNLTLAHRSLGQVYLTMDEAESALRHLALAAEQSPQDAIVHMTLAQVYKTLGEDQRAAEAARKSRSVKGSSTLPDRVRLEVERLAVDPSSCAARAERSMQQGKFAEALRDLELFAEASPDHPIGQFKIGTCYLQTGQPDLAFTHLSRAVELKSDLTPARVQLASLYQRRGQPGAAIDQLRGALVHDPDNGRIRAMLGFALSAVGDLDGAVVELERADALMAPNADRLFRLGLVLERLGRTDEAIRRYRRAVDLAPGHQAARRLAALAL